MNLVYLVTIGEYRLVVLLTYESTSESRDIITCDNYHYALISVTITVCRIECHTHTFMNLIRV